MVKCQFQYYILTALPWDCGKWKELAMEGYCMSRYGHITLKAKGDILATRACCDSVLATRL